MATDEERLIVTLEARVSAFEKQLRNAAKTADDSFKSIEQGSKRASDALDKASNRSGAAVQQLNKQTGLARYEMINLSRQIQDVGVSLASGQSPFTVLVQQGTQVGDIFANTQGTFRGFASQVRSILTPTRLLAGGLVAVGAGAVAAVSYWKNFALSLDDTARAAGVTVEEMSKLQAIASFKGVSTDEFSKGIQSFAAQLYQAKNNAGELREVFRVNGVEVRGTSDALEKLADLIQRSTSYQQKLNILQKAGLPTSAEFVRFMDQGAEGIRRAKDGVAEFGGAMNSEMIARAREFDEAWARAWTNFGLEARSAIVQAAGYLTNLSDAATRALGSVLPGGLSTIGSNLLKTGKGTPLSQDVSGMYGSLLKPGVKPTIDPDAIRDVERMTDALRRQVDQQRIELAVQGMSADKATAYRALQEQLLDAKYRHIQLSPQQIAALEKEAGALGALTKATDNARASVLLLRDVQFERAQLGRSNAEQQIASRLRSEYGDENYMAHMDDAVAGQMRLNATMRETKDLAETALGTFVADLMEGKTATEALNNALKNVQRTLLQAATNQLISAAFGSIGLPVALKHSGYGPGDPISTTRYVDPTAFIGAPRLHSGVGPGERAAIIRQDESILTPGQMRALGTQIGGGGAIINNVNVSVAMPAGGKPEDGNRFGQEISRAIVATVQAEMIKQRRHGGLLRGPS